MLLTRQRATEALTDIIESDLFRLKDNSFERALAATVEAFNKDLPLKQEGSLTLEAGKQLYGVPECFTHFIRSNWGIEHTAQYDQFTPPPPRIYSAHTVSGLAIEFSPAPTQLQINRFGSTFHYIYATQHVFTDDESSIATQHYELFITRALAAVMRELVAAGVTQPIQLNRGVSITREQTPHHAYKILMNEYKEQVQHVKA